MKTKEEWIQESNWINLVHEVFNDFRYRSNNPDYKYEFHIESPEAFSLIFKKKVYFGLWTHTYRADFRCVFVVDDEDKEKLVGLNFYYHYFNVGNSSHASNRSSMHYPNAQDLIDDFKENYYWLHIED